jgi:hypothetical protein
MYCTMILKLTRELYLNTMILLLMVVLVKHVCYDLLAFFCSL